MTKPNLSNAAVLLPAEQGDDLMSPAMWSALGSMPVRLRRTRVGWVIPVGGPCRPSLDALVARGLCLYDDEFHAWMRTAVGDAVWANR